MIKSEDLFNIYQEENPLIFTGTAGQSDYVDKEKFFLVSENLIKDFDPDNYSSEKEARRDLKSKASNIQVSGIGVIEFFILRSIASWIIKFLIKKYVIPRIFPEHPQGWVDPNLL
jgi:hypothetical protein